MAEGKRQGYADSLIPGKADNRDFGTGAEKTELLKDTKFADIIRKNGPDLEELVDVGVMSAYLYAYEVVDIRVKQNIEAERTRIYEVRELLNHIGRGDVARFEGFLQALWDSNQHHIVTQIFGLRPRGTTMDAMQREVMHDSRLRQGSVEMYSGSQPSPIKKAVLDGGHISNRDDDKRIDLDEEFVNLRLVSGDQALKAQDMDPGRYQDYLQKSGEEKIQMTDLLKYIKRKQDSHPGQFGKEDEVTRPLLLVGRAGVGKSTLIQKLMRLWAQGKWAQKFKAVFLFNIRNLTVVDKRVVTLNDFLEFFTIYYFRDAERDIKRVLRDEKLLLLFIDGIDELPGLAEKLRKRSKLHGVEREPLSWCIDILRRHVLGESVVVLASRPFEELYRIGCDPILEVVGLTKDGVMEFIDKHVSEDKREIVKTKMLNSPLVLSVSSITYFCMMFCQVLEDAENVDVDDLTTYTRLLAFFILKYMARCPRPDSSASICLPPLSRLAYKGLVENHVDEDLPALVFYEEDLEAVGLGKTEVNTSVESGILLVKQIAASGSSSSNVSTSEFVHLTIQEMLAMTQLMSKDKNTLEEMVDIIWQTESFNMARLFLYGLSLDLSSKHRQQLLSPLKSALHLDDSHQAELEQVLINKIKTGSSNQLQQLQIVYETQREDIAEAVAHDICSDGEMKIENTLLTLVDINAIIFMLMVIPKLLIFRLNQVTVDYACVSALYEGLARLEGLGTLQTLQLVFDGLTMEPAMDGASVTNFCKALEKMFTLHTLQLAGMAVHGTSLISLLMALKSKVSLRKLHLLIKGIGGGMLNMVDSVLSELNNLTDFGLDVSELIEGEVTCLFQFLTKYRNIDSLRLKGYIFTPDVIRLVSPVLEDNTSWKHLNLSDCGIDYECLKLLLKAVKMNRTLKTLDVTGIRIEKEKVQEVMDELKENHCLEALWLTDANGRTVTLLPVPDTQRWVQVRDAGDGETHIYAWCLQDLTSSSCLLHTHTVWGQGGVDLILDLEDEYTDLYGGGRPAVSADTWSLTLEQYTSSPHSVDGLFVYLSASASLSPLLTSLTPATIASLTHKLGIMWVYHGEVSCTELISWLSSSITTQPGWAVSHGGGDGAKITTSHSYTLDIWLMNTRVRASLQEQQQHQHHLGRGGINLLNEPEWITE